MSTSHYKRYNNPLLLQLEDRYSDVKIGSINLPHITVADDLAVMSRSYGSQQVKVWHVDNNTCRERYCVNPVKSSTLFYHFNRKVNRECTEILLAGDKISNDQKTTHLGIDRTLPDRRKSNNVGDGVEKKCSAPPDPLPFPVYSSGTAIKIIWILTIVFLEVIFIIYILCLQLWIIDCAG